MFHFLSVSFILHACFLKPKFKVISFWLDWTLEDLPLPPEYDSFELLLLLPV